VRWRTVGVLTLYMAVVTGAEGAVQPSKGGGEEGVQPVGLPPWHRKRAAPWHGAVVHGEGSGGGVRKEKGGGADWAGSTYWAS
jgi:hypothetical protein